MRRLCLVSCATLALFGGCGSSVDSSVDAKAQTKHDGSAPNGASGSSPYFACESISGVGTQVGVHFCMEYQSTKGKFDLAQIAPGCVDSAQYTGPHGFGLSTTLHCPRTLPGCGCTDNDSSRTGWQGQYQTELDNDVYNEVRHLCGSAAVECFGGVDISSIQKLDASISDTASSTIDTGVGAGISSTQKLDAGLSDTSCATLKACCDSLGGKVAADCAGYLTPPVESLCSLGLRQLVANGACK